jgi:hypothetical protein
VVDALGLLADRLDPPTVDVFGILGYEPSARQQVFHDATEFDVLYGGAAGGGKTRALLMEGIRACVRHPGIRVGAFRRTYDELAESFFPELAHIGYAADVGARWNGSDRELRFANGSLIRFRYLETVMDATRRQGGQYQLVLLDERTLIPPDAVSILVDERIRTGSVNIPVLGVRSGTNPGGPGHGQCRDRYIVPTDYGQSTYTDSHGRTVRFIPAKVSDNPHIERADPGYIRRLDAIPDPARRAAMRDGSWDSFAGQVFQEWRHDRHVVPRFAIPGEWRRVAGVDWGYAAPWCVLWAAVDGDGRIWFYRERYERQVGETDQAQRILADEHLEPVSPIRFADPSMWKQNGEGLPIADRYGVEGVALVPANNDRVPGLQRLHTALADGAACLHHRDLGWERCPRLHVLEATCPNLVRTLPMLPYDRLKVEDVDTDAEDHAYDAARYLVMGVGAGSTIIDEPEPEPERTLDGSKLQVPAGGRFAMPREHLFTNVVKAAPPAQGDKDDAGWI